MGDGALLRWDRSNQTRIAPRAVLRRSEGTWFSSLSADEVGALARRDPRGASASGWCCVYGIHGRLTIPICRELLDLKAEPTKRSGSG